MQWFIWEVIPGTQVRFGLGLVGETGRGRKPVQGMAIRGYCCGQLGLSPADILEVCLRHKEVRVFIHQFSSVHG